MKEYIVFMSNDRDGGAIPAYQDFIKDLQNLTIDNILGDISEGEVKVDRGLIPTPKDFYSNDRIQHEITMMFGRKLISSGVHPIVNAEVHRKSELKSKLETITQKYRVQFEIYVGIPSEPPKPEPKKPIKYQTQLKKY